MTTVSILGKGNMGSAIAGVAEKAGANVELFDSSDTSKAVTGDIVVLAVPYPAVSGIVEQRGAQLAGKIVVDITNPLDFATFDGLVVPADGSAAAMIASKVPGATVLKAFNTTFAATLSSKTVGGLPTTVLIAGDDDSAKATLTEIVLAGGLRAIDAGSLKRARELEAIGFLQITLAAAERISWTGGFAVAS